MKVRRTLLIVITLLVIGAWCISSPPPRSRPSILFVGFRDAPDGQAAVFLVTNSTASPYTYVGVYAATTPYDYVYQVRPGSEWQTMTRITAGIAAETKTLPAHSSFEFTAKPPFESSGPFAVGITFFSPGEVRRIKLSYYLRLLRLTTHSPEVPDYTWSEVTSK